MSTVSRFPAADRGQVVLDIDRTSRGLWEVSSRDRRIGGIFVSRKAALAFAHDEGEALPRAVVEIHDRDATTREEFANHRRVATMRVSPVAA